MNQKDSDSIVRIFQNAPADLSPEEMQNLFKILGTDRLLMKFK